MTVQTVQTVTPITPERREPVTQPGSLSVRELIIQLRDLEDQLLRTAPLATPAEEERRRARLQQREMTIIGELRRRQAASAPQAS